MGNHQQKWWSKMVAIHGSEDAVRDVMRSNASKSSRNSKGTGGFAYLARHNPELLRSISRKGRNARTQGTENSTGMDNDL